jgi:hypothetical protein
MFCGECGRSQAAAQFVPPPPAPVAPTAPHVTCAQCGTAMSADDIFCGECGFVASSVTDAFTTGQRPQIVHEAPQHDAPREAEPAAPVRPNPNDTAANDTARIELLDLLDLAELEVETPPDIATEPAFSPMPPIASSIPPPPFASPALPDDVEATRIVRRNPVGERFVLQFSTGENVTVTGSGLLGRSPRPQPGEYFDHVVSITDPGRSVSKTHLEFGQDAGSFWVSDRFSGNGTVVREPESGPVRCDPGKRYHLVRGSRVDIGEQFLIVS